MVLGSFSAWSFSSNSHYLKDMDRVDSGIKDILQLDLRSTMSSPRTGILSLVRFLDRILMWKTNHIGLPLVLDHAVTL